MKTEDKHRFTANIAGVEPFVFRINLEDEAIFRKAVYHVNHLAGKFQADQPDKPLTYTLAKVALAFAELYYRKSEQLTAQSELLENFEKVLDDVLLTTE